MAKKIKNEKGRNTKNSTLQKRGKREKYNIDDEIVIGLNLQETNKPVNKRINKKQQKHRQAYKKNKNTKLIKYLCILFLLIIAILLFFMSPIFNIEKINIIGNEKTTISECIKLSELEIGQNIYKMSKRQIKNNIKQNAYIDKVYITRKLPNIINITVEERTATYMIELENNEYAYINNQGYILEKSYIKLESAVITGFSTNIENINVGNRLNEKDLKKLETVLKIVDSAQNNNLSQYITKINVEDKENYILILEGEKKTVNLGDASNISTRMLYLKAILEKEKEKEGEIFINGNVNTDKAFFREKV